MKNRKKKLPIGIENFEKLQSEGFYYIDKTSFIQALLEDWAEVNLFTRPRRFGKSLNMSMLKSFFELGTDPGIFQNLAIAEETALCEEYMGQFPVISVSLKGINGNTYQMALDIIDNPKHLEIVEMDIMSTGRAILETDASITTASIAADVGVDPNVYLFRSREFRAMGMFVRSDTLDEPWAQDYAAVINSQELKDKFNDYYKGVYVLYEDMESIA